MRFILLRIARDDSTAPIPGTGIPPSPRAPNSMTLWRSDLEKAGVLVAHDRLLPATLGARVFVEHGEAQVLAPPFREVPEVVYGYWLLEVGSLKEAVSWARRCPAEPGFVIEVRQIEEPLEDPKKVRKVVAGFRSTLPPG